MTHLMITTLPTTGITFLVDDVTPGTKTLLTESLRQTTTEGIGKEAPDEEMKSTWRSPARSPYRQLALHVAKDVVVRRAHNSGHPILDAVHMAFAHHLPLTFTPDAIWQTIVQGVAHHVLSAPEEHRKQFVRFEGKQAMRILRSDLSLDDLDAIGAATGDIVAAFAKGLSEQVTPAYYEALTQSFSTTTAIERTAAQVALMEVFSPYFDYQMFCACGFPSITLAGSPEDWRAMRIKLNQIEELFDLSPTLNLTWWTSKLRVVLDQFVAAAEGNPDRAWWKRMYKQMDVYANYQFNGWIGWLWPYTKTYETYGGEGKGWIKPESPWRRNPMLESIEDTVTIVDNGGGSYGMDGNGNRLPETRRKFTFGDDNQRLLSGLSWFTATIKDSCFMYTSDFPLGKSSVPLKIVDLRSGKELDTTLIGGFMGVTQSEADYGLTPQLGYALLA